MYGNDAFPSLLLFALEQSKEYQYTYATKKSEDKRKIQDKSTQESMLNPWALLGDIFGNRGSFDGHELLRRWPYMHVPAGRVFTNPRLHQVKRMLTYWTKGASTYIGGGSTRPKLRNNSSLVLQVERYAQDPTLLESPGPRTHDLSPIWRELS